MTRIISLVWYSAFDSGAIPVIMACSAPANPVTAPEITKACSFNLQRLKLQAFVISGAVTGLAGALHAMMTGIAPLSNAEYHTSEMILVMTVIGGTGNLFASVLGSAFYVLLADWLST